jgi:hypothetical protein
VGSATLFLALEVQTISGGPDHFTRILKFALEASRISHRTFLARWNFLVGIRGPGSTCINGRVQGLSFNSPNDQSSSQFAVNYSALKSWGLAQTEDGGTKCGLPEKSEIKFRLLRRP